VLALSLGMRRLDLVEDVIQSALVKDLERMGLLDRTLVVWGGEFGRTPFGQEPPPLSNDR
jgi:hypothetical protein